MRKIKEEIEERAADVATADGKRKIKEEAPDSSFPPFGTVTVRKSIDDVAAPPGISKRKIKEEPSDSFRPFGTVAVRKDVQSIDDVARPVRKRKIKEEVQTVAIRKSIDDVAPPGIRKRKIKKEPSNSSPPFGIGDVRKLIDYVAPPIAIRKRKIKEEVNDQIIVKPKKPKTFHERNFMLVNIQAQGKKTGKKMLKTLIEKADLNKLKFTPVRSVLKISNRCIVHVTAFTEENAQLIEERIEKMRWHELFSVDSLKKAKAFFWKPLKDEQIITAILLATYQQNLGTPPTKRLGQMLQDKIIIQHALGSVIIMRKLREKLNKPVMKMLESIRKDIPKDTPKMKEQPVPPGDIQIQPSTKIVFNAPFHANRINFINIKNTSARRIAYRIHISQSHQTRLGVEHPHGVLDPKESVLVAVTCYAAPLRHVVDTVIYDCINIEWINTPDGPPKRFRCHWFEAPAISRYKNLPIEYNA